MTIHLFIAGTGGVGKALWEQIRDKSGFLFQNQDLTLEVNGIINSRKMILSHTPLPYNEPFNAPHWEEAHIDRFIHFIKRLQIPHAVFVDVTASASVAGAYLTLFQSGIHVVACNKIACAAPMAHYSRLKKVAAENKVAFLYNTNVGAALPYLQSIRQLYQTGERIDKVEAVLSGTLNYIFDRYDGTTPFAQIVRDAQQAGYTEPDPRIDLQGIDVMRKLLILCREMGVPLEESEVKKTSFLPEHGLQASISIEEFYTALTQNEAHFKQLYQQAQKEGSKLKYVATYHKGMATIGLQNVPPHNPIFGITQKDNILLIHSQNYPAPLTIMGAGAGAQVTAMGVLSDIVALATEKISNFTL